jgi:hypothetical protein
LRQFAFSCSWVERLIHCGRLPKRQVASMFVNTDGTCQASSQAGTGCAATADVPGDGILDWRHGTRAGAA